MGRDSIEEASSSFIEEFSSNVTERSSSSSVSEESSSTSYFSSEEDFDCSYVSLDLTGELIESYQGCYRITSQFNRTSFGTIYRCQQIKTGKRFAVKHYSHDCLRSEEMMPMIENEIRIMNRLNHPNTISLADSLYTKDGLFMFTELVKSRTLINILPTSGGITECCAREIFSQLLDGLEHLHQHRIVHRDINLENVIIDQSGRVKIINYDLAEYVPRDRHEEGALLVKTECGSLKYLAPEVIEKRRRYYRGDLADIWAAGILLHVLVTGRFPFDHHKERTIRRKIRNFETHKFLALIGYMARGEEEYMSIELRHLLYYILVRITRNRPSIEKIRKHPWMRGVSFAEASKRAMETFTNDEKDVSVI